MRFLRLLSNSIVGGALAAGFVTIVLLQLNPALTVGVRLLPLALLIALSYGVHFTVFWYVLLAIQQVLATDPPSPGWLSLRLLTWIAAITSGCAAVLIWLNARGFLVVLEPEAHRRMQAGGAVVSGCAVVFLLLAVVHVRAGGRRRAAIAALFTATLVAAFAGPLTLRGPATRPAAAGRRESTMHAAKAPVPQRRVVLVLLDGASLDVIATAAAGGRLPNFGRMLDRGAALHLATLRPTQPEPVWTAVATGKWPSKTGIRSAAIYHARGGGESFDLLPDHCFAYALVRFGLLEEQRYLSTALAAPPVWQILDAYGFSVGVIGWPVTYPAPAVRGYVVSDRFLRTTDPAVELHEMPAVYPPEVADEVRLALRELPAGPLDTMLAASSLLSPGDDRQSRAAAIQADRVHRHLTERLQADRPTDFTAVRLQAIDAVGHYYLRYARPRDFGDVTDEERRQYGRVLDQEYAKVDAAVGRALGSLGPDDLLLVVSGFGMEPLTPAKRLFERVAGNPLLSGTHERAPDGFMLAYGEAVQRGRLPRGSIVDVAPTVLYYLGVPIGRDMDGYVRTDVFARRFTEARPIAVIPSHDR